ncbi:hypothetical protein FKM82_001113 [Ascaphus truei]
MYEVFQRGNKVSNNGPCLGHRKPNQPYEWISYQEVSDRAEYVGSALLHRGFKAASDTFVGIFAQNRPEWVITELACYTYSMVAVPLYDTLGAEAITYVINKGIGHFVFCKKNGAMLTHKNIVSNSSAFLKVTEDVVFPSTKDVLISFLPLAHMFERVVECVILCHGARIGFFQGDIRLLMDDLKVLQPTIFPVVPRLLNRMFDRIYGQANTPIKRWMLEFASKRKEAELRSGIIRNNSLWDKIIFGKVQASLGGKVRLLITGAAPVSPTVLTFLRGALGCQARYGQTECTAGCSLTVPGDWTAGHVGAPMPCNQIKLVDVEEMQYFAAKGEGEVCVKGPNVFNGYLKDAEKTAEALDKDGWLHTGDVGKWLPNGTLKLIDRKKHIFKLAQGEYIAPEKIENIYTRCEPVGQIFVYGESLQAFLVGIVVLDPDNVLNWAKKRKFKGSYEQLCKDKEFKTVVLEDLVRLGKEAGLKTFEQVKDIAIHPEMFSIENGLLTPTLKAKRPELRKYFESQINELYANNKV